MQEKGSPVDCVHVSAEDLPESFLELLPNVGFIELIFGHCLSVHPNVRHRTHPLGAKNGKGIVAEHDISLRSALYPGTASVQLSERKTSSGNRFAWTKRCLYSIFRYQNDPLAQN
jgi:hypothetical protein